MHLWQYGRRIEANARHCPRTMALIAGFPNHGSAAARPMRCSRCWRREPASRRTTASPTPGWSAICR
ncbi:hypothetical protein ACFSTI_07845 [Rhizorhabdus histidinilytica]